MKMKIINCNPKTRLPLTGANEDFYWPDTPAKHQAILDQAESFLLELLQEEGSSDLQPLSQTDIICLFAPTWMQLLTKILLAMAIDLAEKEEHKLEFSTELYPFWSDYINDRTLADHPALAQLSQGPRTTKALWRWPARIIRTLARGDIIKRYPYVLFNKKRHTACTGNLSVMADFCKQHRYKGFYVEPDIFFTKLTPKDLEETSAETKLIERLHRRFLELLDAHFLVRENARIWLRRQISITVIYSQRYVAQTSNNQNTLPTNLISNLGGVWNGLLRYAVTKSGGTTHVIDHGCGSAFLNTTMNSLTNLAGTSVFYAFTKLSETLIRNNLNVTIRKACRQADIRSFPHPEFKEASKAKPRSSHVHSKSILVVPLGPLYDRGLMLPYASTVAATDFNARLFIALKDLGWTVAAKPHPGFMEFDANLFPEKYGVHCESRTLEDALPHYGVIINCDPSSSILGPCLYSHKPLLLVNAYPGHLSSETMGIVSARAGILAMNYENNGRISLDSNNLANALEDAMLKTNNCDFKPLFQEH